MDYLPPPKRPCPMFGGRGPEGQTYIERLSWVSNRVGPLDSGMCSHFEGRRQGMPMMLLSLSTLHVLAGLSLSLHRS